MHVGPDHCAGLDVPQKTGVAWVLLPPMALSNARCASSRRCWLISYSTRMGERRCGCGGWPSRGRGLLETGVHNRLAGGRTMVLVNPPHCKAVPGRTPEVKESEWVADNRSLCVD